MKILLCSATSFEISKLLHHLDNNGRKISFFEYELNHHRIFPLVTGVGAMQTAFALSRFSLIKEINFAINAGIAGSYNELYDMGQVVEVFEDRFADLGVEHADGRFEDVYDLQLEKANKFPYSNGWINNVPKHFANDLAKVRGLTVNKVSGCESSITAIKNKYSADIESMEGAGFLYACKIMDVDCIQIRSISNYVEPRNKDNWKLDLALDNLNDTLINFLEDPASHTTS